MSADRLAAAADRAEIMAVLSAYAHAIDRRDEALLATCFHPDSTHAHGAFEGLSRDFLGFAAAVLEALSATHHHLSIPFIRIENDIAHVETYFTAYHRVPADAAGDAVFPGKGVAYDVVIGGRYLDRFERRDGVWRIAHRQGVHDWLQEAPASDARLGPAFL